jgi:hypothetical protein
MEEKQIQITFKHVLHESTLPEKDCQEISKSINDTLESIREEIISSQATVEVIESENGTLSVCQYVIIQI